MALRKRQSELAVGMAAALLLGGGVGYRALARQIDAALARSMKPAEPLDLLPERLGEWQGTDVPLADGVRRVPGFDDFFINRRYVEPRGRQSVGLFIGYTGRPRTRLGHRPDVCYAAHGWEQVSSRPIAVTTADGHSVPTVLYRFRSPDFLKPGQLVLATYLVSGTYCTDPVAYNRGAVRDPKLFSARSPYLARIQISLVESSDSQRDVSELKRFASLVIGPVTRMMPYWLE